MTIKEKETSVIVDNQQIRTAIPKEFADFIDIKKGEYKMGWTLDESRQEVMGILMKRGTSKE